jgi:hypothetical protein
MIDYKLLQDIAPYAYAYGHTMSNILYAYKRGCAVAEKTGLEQDLKYVEFLERWIRSFTITKNITYSRKLIEKDMKLKWSDLHCTNLPYDEYKETVKEADAFINEQRKNGNKKSEAEIRCENFKFCYPDSPLPNAMLTSIENPQWSALDFGGIVFQVVLFKTEVSFQEQIYLNIYREGITNPKLQMEISDAVNMFPELLKCEWSDRSEFFKGKE